MAPPSLRIRPILKRTWSYATTQGDTTAQTLPFAACKDVVVLSPHVHFPPTPIISSTHAAHSPATYDRRPIVSTPTDDAFPDSPSTSPVEPERRGRTGRDEDPIKGSYFHPRAYEACGPEEDGETSSLEPPPLMRDSPSSSTYYEDDEDEDDDDEAITPPDPKLPASLIIPQALRNGSSAFKSTGALGGDDSPLWVAPTGPKMPQGVPRIRTENGPFIVLRNRMSPNEGEGCLGGF